MYCTMFTMAISSEYVFEGNLVEVGFAKDFQDSVRNSKITNYKDKELEVKILKANPEEVLIVTSTINSPKTITSVESYNEAIESIQ